MNNIKKETKIKKRKIENVLSMFLAGSLAVFIYGYIYQFSILISATFIYSLLNVFSNIHTYKKISKLEKIIMKLENKISKKEISEKEAIVVVAKCLKNNIIN